MKATDAIQINRRPPILAFYCLLALLLTACSSFVPSSQLPEAMPYLPCSRRQAAIHQSFYG